VNFGDTTFFSSFVGREKLTQRILNRIPPTIIHSIFSLMIQFSHGNCIKTTRAYPGISRTCACAPSLDTGESERNTGIISEKYDFPDEDTAAYATRVACHPTKAAGLPVV
jgi:hypothetical protein